MSIRVGKKIGNTFVTTGKSGTYTRTKIGDYYVSNFNKSGGFSFGMIFAFPIFIIGLIIYFLRTPLALLIALASLGLEIFIAVPWIVDISIREGTPFYILLLPLVPFTIFSYIFINNVKRFIEKRRVKNENNN